MKNTLLLLVFSQIIIGCAHYFSNSYNVESDIKVPIKNIYNICITYDWLSGNMIKSDQDQNWSNNENIYLINNLTKIFPKFDFKCQKSNDLLIKYSQFQTRGSSDISVATLGIFPAILPTKYFINVYDRENNLIFTSQNK